MKNCFFIAINYNKVNNNSVCGGLCVRVCT